MIKSLTLSTYRLGAYKMHKVTETLDSLDSSIETGIVGIGRNEEEALENYEQNKISGTNSYEHLATA